MKFLFAILLLNTSCQSKNPFPSKMPADFKIEYRLDGGMSDLHRKTVLQLGDCSDDVKDEDKPEVEYDWKNQNQKEFEELYLSLKKLNAFTLKYSNKGDVLDRGGESLQFTIEGKDYMVSDAQSNFIDKKDSDAFASAIKMILDFTEKYRK